MQVIQTLVNMDELYETLSSLPKEYIEYFILRLMKDEKISFSQVATIHVKYLEALKQGETEKLMTLRSKFIDLWCGTKKALPNKIVELMQEAMSEGWANITQEQIDASKWKK